MNHIFIRSIDHNNRYTENEMDHVCRGYDWNGLFVWMFG